MDDQIEAAGQLLLVSATHSVQCVRRFAEAAAKVVARDGLDVGRGWLQGIWYIGGNNRVANEAEQVTYHDVVAALQGALGVALVTAR
jgi:hypothetical protein